MSDARKDFGHSRKGGPPDLTFLIADIDGVARVYRPRLSAAIKDGSRWRTIKEVYSRFIEDIDGPRFPVRPLAAHPLTVHESAARCDRLCRRVAARSNDARPWADLIGCCHGASRTGDHSATGTDTAGAIDTPRALDGLCRGQRASEQRRGHCDTDESKFHGRVPFFQGSPHYDLRSNRTDSIEPNQRAGR